MVGVSYVRGMRSELHHQAFVAVITAHRDALRPLTTFSIPGPDCGEMSIPGELDVPIHAYTQSWHAHTGFTYSVGGYLERRSIYAGDQFTDGDEPRTIHLGVDVGGPAGTPVFLPLDGTIHSLADNALPYDYGPTIITRHELDGVVFHLLFGHLSRADIEGLAPGRRVEAGWQVGRFGAEHENGGWHPHLHLQVVLDMEGKTGDYPGVCRAGEVDRFRWNCPNPRWVIGINRSPKTPATSRRGRAAGWGWNT